MNITVRPILKKGLTLGGVALTVLALITANSHLRTATAGSVEPLGVESSVAEVLGFAENSNNAWQTVHVKGHSQVDGVSSPFETWVQKPRSYRSEEGEGTFIRNNLEQMIILPALRKVERRTLPEISESDQAERKARMDIHRAEDPTLAREGEQAVDTPVNDLVNPSYFVRKELRHTAKTVEKVGIATVAGRQAIQLKVTFPKELAKEDYWDVFVDTETGILLGFVIQPLPGNPKFETFIDKLEVNPAISSGRFDLSVPAGYTAN